MSRRPEPVLVLLLSVALSGAAAGTDPVLRAPPELLPIPYPAVDRMEDGVQEQLRAERKVLDRYLTQEGVDPETLGLAFAAMGQLYQLYDLSRPAVACFENARRLLPADYRWPYHLGVLHQLNGDLERARDRLAEAASLAPRDLPARIRLGQVLVELSDLEGAETRFREVLVVDPEIAAARYGLGRIAYAQGDLEDAVRQLEAALALQPTADSIHHLLGMAYRQSGELELARSHLALNRHTPVSFADPLLERLVPAARSAHRHFRAGTDAMGVEDYDAAVEHFRSGLVIDSENALTRYNLALALLALERYEEAEAELRRSLELDPGHGHAHYNLGVLLTETGRLEEAVQHFGSAQELDPTDPQAHLEWAAALGRLGRFAEAAAAFDRAVEIAPANLDVHFGRAMALIFVARYPEALAALEQGLQALPGNPALTHLLARFLATCPDPDVRDGERAIELATQVFERHQSLEHAETVAMALAESGRFEEAVEWQRRVVAETDATRGVAAMERSRRRLASYRNQQPVRSPWAEVEERGHLE